MQSMVIKKDASLDKKFERMSRQCANSMNGTHAPRKTTRTKKKGK